MINSISSIIFLFLKIPEINQEGIVNQKQGQQKHAMITKNGLLRPNRNSSLIMSSKPKTKPTRTDPSEPNIDFNNIPTIQGTYRATKVNITAENATKGISEPIIDNKGLIATTRRAPSHKHTTPSQKVSNLVESSSTVEPSTFYTKSTAATLSKNKPNEKQENEMKITSLRTTTVRSDLNIFKDFRNPDFENNSPWKPIVPGYVNTEFKLLPNDDVRRTSYTESTTRKVVLTTSDSRDNVRTPNAGISMIPSTVPGLPLDSINFRDVPEINNFDTDNTNFPRDRIVPDLTASRPSDNGKLDIEVAGQLPSEMYSVKLKASSGHNGDDRVTSSSEISMIREVSENIPTKDNVFQEKHTGSNATRKTEAKFDDSASTVEPDNIFGSRSDEKIMNDSLTSGVGIAEPVPDTEVELEAKNRYKGSEIMTLTTDEDALRNRKVNINPQQPIYTSYNTPDLNGGSLGSSLIENPATTKPFRHTIPVDKITSVVNYSINVPLHNLDTLTLSDDTTTDAKLSQDKVLTALPPKRVEVETSVTEHDDAMDQLTSYGQITSTEPNVVQIIKNDTKLSHFGTTESHSEPKLIAKDSGGKRNVSRNSTFVEIDIVKHTPGESEENWESYADQVTVNDGLQKKKVYNETLKAYVVENLVTLSPAKSNTGIGRPVRPKPKIDFPDHATSLLEQLFGVHNYTHDRDTTNTESAISESSSSYKITDSTKSNEKESSNHKSTIVEQIVEVVTSISTRVSSSIKSDPVILKFIVTNSTTNPVVHSEETSDDEAIKSLESAISTTEKILSWTEKRPFLQAGNLRTMQTSDRKMLALEENRVLLEKLKQLAQIKTNDDITRNNSSSSEMLQPQDPAPSLNIDELKKIADVVTGNETLQNASLGFTLSRDGVEIFTKVLNKEEDGTHKDETHTMSTIRKISETNGNCARATRSIIYRGKSLRSLKYFGRSGI